MGIKYHIQELPRMREGEKVLYPRHETYSSFDNEKMCELISDECGYRTGMVEAVLRTLPSALKRILLEGHSCSIRGLGVFSLSLTTDRKGNVMLKGLNVKWDPHILKQFRDEARFEISTTDIVRPAPSKGHRNEHFALLEKWFENHNDISLSEYVRITGVSAPTASRELKYFCSNGRYGIEGCGNNAHKVWKKKT